jgi:hypothetical protein
VKARNNSSMAWPMPVNLHGHEPGPRPAVNCPPNPWIAPHRRFFLLFLSPPAAMPPPGSNPLEPVFQTVAAFSRRLLIAPDTAPDDHRLRPLLSLSLSPPPPPPPPSEVPKASFPLPVSSPFLWMERPVVRCSSECAGEGCEGRAPDAQGGGRPRHVDAAPHHRGAGAPSLLAPCLLSCSHSNGALFVNS